MTRLDSNMEIGDLVTVQIDRVAHGGHMVARHNGHVIFVRHALPGETVRVRITERAKSFLRADVFEVLAASSERVRPPCQWAAACGGCDFQHVSADYQRELLGTVVSEQLQRLAHVDFDVQVEEVQPILGWRTRVDWTVGPDGRSGLLASRSHTVVPVDRCLIAHPEIPRPVKGEPGQRLRGIVSSTGERQLLDLGSSESLEPVHEKVGENSFSVNPRGFWQVHPQAALSLTEAVLSFAAARKGDTVFDLYSGAGLFTKPLADKVTELGRVFGVEGSRSGHADAQVNVGGAPHVRLIRSDVEHALLGPQLPSRCDVVVLDPPRAGAKRAILPIAQRQPRAIVHVACDPASLARDVKIYAEQGYRLADLRAFALFPMTHHVECVALLRKAA